MSNQRSPSKIPGISRLIRNNVRPLFRRTTKKKTTSCQTEPFVLQEKSKISFNCRTLLDKREDATEEDYTKVLSFINLCHEKFNTRIKEKYSESTKIFLLPTVVNFIPLYNHLMGKTENKKESKKVTNAKCNCAPKEAKKLSPNSICVKECKNVNIDNKAKNIYAPKEGKKLSLNSVRDCKKINIDNKAKSFAPKEAKKLSPNSTCDCKKVNIDNKAKSCGLEEAKKLSPNSICPKDFKKVIIDNKARNSCFPKDAKKPTSNSICVQDCKKVNIDYKAKNSCALQKATTQFPNPVCDKNCKKVNIDNNAKSCAPKEAQKLSSNSISVDNCENVSTDNNNNEKVTMLPEDFEFLKQKLDELILICRRQKDTRTDTKTQNEKLKTQPNSASVPSTSRVGQNLKKTKCSLVWSSKGIMCQKVNYSGRTRREESESDVSETEESESEESDSEESDSEESDSKESESEESESEESGSEESTSYKSDTDTD